MTLMFGAFIFMLDVKEMVRMTQVSIVVLDN